MKIFLIGMPGSGKSTLGKDLASRLMLDFVDLDAEIEKAEQRKISDIFRERGEEYFRTVEARLLREWAAIPSGFVMATGGGAPCFHNGMDTINQSGISIFLDVPVAELVRRVKENRDRPLLISEDDDQLMKKLSTMRSSRLECYRRSQISIQQPSVEAVLEKIGAKS